MKTRKVNVEYRTPPPYASTTLFTTDQCTTTGWIKDLQGNWVRPEEYVNSPGFHVIMYPGDNRHWISPTVESPDEYDYEKATPGTTGPLPIV